MRSIGPRARAGRRFRLPVLFVVSATLAIGCGDDGSSEVGVGAEIDGSTAVVVANSPGTVSTNGPQRVLVALLGDGPTDFVGGPDLPATLEFRPSDDATGEEVEAEWLATPGSPFGMYVTHYEFDEPGIWEVHVVGSDDNPGAVLEVTERSSIPEAGDPAPRSTTPTASSLDEALEISSDPDPALRFYGTSIDEAVTNGTPSVIVFATPAFCQTATCGPTVELVKEVADDHPAVDFVHVEPYELELAREGELVPVAVMDEWSLLTEPWVFVVDAEGDVSASFEGLIGPDELSTALDELG